MLIKRILFLVTIYSILRIIFFFANLAYFEGTSLIDISIAFIRGIRFDLSAIFYINIPILLLHTFPFRSFYKKSIQKFIKWLFLILNLPFILLNLVDSAFFAFQGKRSTTDLMKIITMGEDIRNNIFSMMADFWYVPLLFIFMIWVFNKRYPKAKEGEHKNISWVKSVLYFLITAALTVFFIRGGTQLKPLRIMSAVGDNNPKLAPLVLNSSFTFLRTLGKQKVVLHEYMPKKDLTNFFNPIKKFTQQPFQPYNVVILILESFSTEYIGYYNEGVGYTPFLDSLLAHSYTFNNSFANAKRSIDGLPAISSSLPALLPESYITSVYSGNKLSGIAGYLDEKGYESSFFHGGNNGTMGFDNFTLTTGFKNYYGRSECKECRYDGQWGIYDDDFYNFFISKMNTMHQPFVNCFFSLSSHHPYNIPPDLAASFPSDESPLYRSIRYADYSLGNFFKNASQTNWYSNTLFVITADHTGPSSNTRYNNPVGAFRVPVAYFMPSVLEPQQSNTITQQCDIVPSILDLLNFDKHFVAYGNSVFNTNTPKFSVNYNGNTFQCINDKFVVQFDGESVTGVYDLKTDTDLKNNIYSANDPEQVLLIKSMKSFLQQFNAAMDKNQLTPR